MASTVSVIISGLSFIEREYISLLMTYLLS
nr:MAG TPA: hypothetical protein [Caudoviricetes sp.]